LSYIEKEHATVTKLTEKAKNSDADKMREEIKVLDALIEQTRK
jgi:hypothetical protein